MGSEMILAIDQGTTNTKAVLVDPDGALRARGSHSVGLHTPRPGWVEQDADEIWSSVLMAVAACLADASVPVQVAGIALSSQRESVLAWDDDGRPRSPVIGWQDQRSADDQLLARTDVAEQVRERTGLRPDPMFSAPKLRWLCQNLPHSRRARLGTLDCWLVQRLTGEFTAEAGNASRTLLFDLHSLDWSDELAGIFELPRSALAPVCPSRHEFGRTREVLPLPDGLPVLAVLADSHAALLAQQVFAPGSTKATYGTGTSIMAPATTPQLPGDARVGVTLGWLDHGPMYAHEGNILSSGAALAWTAELLGLPDSAALDRLAAGTPDAGGVTFVPALAGLGAPHWDRSARGQLCGLTTGSGPAQVARAAFEAVAHQVVDVLEEIDRIAPRSFTAIRADGGATASALLMQEQADLSGVPVEVVDTPELSAVGAAVLAWQSLGVNPDLGAVHRTRIHQPRIEPEERANRRAAWAAAVDRAAGHPQDTSAIVVAD